MKKFKIKDLMVNVTGMRGGKAKGVGPMGCDGPCTCYCTCSCSCSGMSCGPCSQGCTCSCTCTCTCTFTGQFHEHLGLKGKAAAELYKALEKNLTEALKSVRAAKAGLGRAKGAAKAKKSLARKRPK